MAKEDDSRPKSKEPNKKSKFKQQQLWAWQPILSPTWVISTFFVVGIIFIPLGAAIFTATEGVVEVSKTYDSDCLDRSTFSCANNGITLTVSEKMKAPVYFYYELSNFYQNHRRYVKSRSDNQLRGQAPDFSALDEVCGEILKVNPNGGSDQSNLIAPCGLIAWSMFNDTFVLRDPSNTIICDSANPDTQCTKTGIAWPADRDTKFKAAASGYYQFPLTYPNETTHTIPSQTDEDLMVWMRTAALPDFRKLWRIYNADINPGEYTLDITERFPVRPFSGHKTFVMSTASWVGGKNDFLGIAYLVVGCLCVACGVLFFFLARFQRKKGYRTRHSKD